MYSWEIAKTMEYYNYNLPSKVYLDITENSPQINKVIYNTYSRKFEISDNEGSHWNFEVYHEVA